jgi:hypothetical protein
MAVDFNYPPVSNQLDTINTFQPEAFSGRDLDNGKLRKPNILISVSTKWVKTMILSFHQAGVGDFGAVLGAYESAGIEWCFYLDK